MESETIGWLITKGKRTNDMKKVLFFLNVSFMINVLTIYELKYDYELFVLFKVLFFTV